MYRKFMILLALTHGFTASHYKILLYLLGTNKALTQSELVSALCLSRQNVHKICVELLRCGAIYIAATEGQKKRFKQAMFQAAEIPLD